MRKVEACGDPGRNGNGPVDSRRDDTLHPLGGRQHPDGRLVLRGYNRSAVDELEAGRGRIAVTGDDVEIALACSAQKSELGRAGP
jgi:hypothetical protein